jgi:hypothetical protein
MPNSMSQIQGHHLTTWGVGFEEAMRVALDNLRQISGPDLEPIAPGVWRSPWRDNYDASRLLLTDLIESHGVEGDPVLMVPNRDTLLLTGSDDVAGLAVMAAAAGEATEHPRPIHAIPVRLEFGSWSPFLPPEGHPSHQDFKRIWVLDVVTPRRSPRHRAARRSVLPEPGSGGQFTSAGAPELEPGPEQDPGDDAWHGQDVAERARLHDAHDNETAPRRGGRAERRGEAGVRRADPPAGVHGWGSDAPGVTNLVRVGPVGDDDGAGRKAGLDGFPATPVGPVGPVLGRGELVLLAVNGGMLAFVLSFDRRVRRAVEDERGRGRQPGVGIAGLRRESEARGAI